MKNQRVRTTVNWVRPGLDFVIDGWLDGRASYLRFVMDGRYLASLDGQRLYRLAKAIVRRFEEE